MLALFPLAALGCSSAQPEPYAADQPPPRPSPEQPVGAPLGQSEPGTAGEAPSDEAASDEGRAAAPVEEQPLPNAPPPPPDDHPRIGALGPHTWIWRRPERKGLAIGKMRVGTSLRLRSPERVDGAGCARGWYAVEPRGYVCNDNAATLDLTDPYYQALAFVAPKPGIWPYSYAHSNGAPMYSRVPTPAEWEKAERGLGPAGQWSSLGEWAKGHEENILDEPIEATDEVPYFLRDGKRTVPGGNYSTHALVWKRIPAGSMLAYARAFEMHGRVWLLTPETMVVPADRVSKLKRSTFRGVYFAHSDMSLPLAWNRSKEPIPIYRRDDQGDFAKTDDSLPAKTPAEITGTPIRRSGRVYYELENEPGRYLGKKADPRVQLDIALVVTRARQKLPRGIGDDEKWIETKIVPGTMTAYVGLEPIMTTLYSPGKGGPPLPDFHFPEDHRKYATTATGYFPLEWKERVATMSNEKGEPKVLWFSDVPYQQYLKAPLAMHVAYWHEDYGIRKSAECLNMSPYDGRWLFQWSLPELPEGWNAVGAGQGNGKSTPFYVTVN